MNMMQSMDQIDYGDIAEGVRRFAAERLYELEKTLRPLVDGSFGEVLPGHLNGYLALLKDLGRLYQLQQPPRYLQDMVPSSKVQEILAGMEERHRREIAEAERLVEMRVRAELSSGQQLSIEAARTQVMSRLSDLESRGSTAS